MSVDSEGEGHQSLRGFVDDLRQRGELHELDEPVDPVYALARVLAEHRRGPAVALHRVLGSALPVVGNVLNSRERIARGLSVGPQEIGERLEAAIEAPVACQIVDEARCQEVDEDPSFETLPIPTFFEAETGPYITAGAIIAKDPDTGRRNLSYARVKPIDPTTAFIGVSPKHHLSMLAQRWAAHDESMPLAIVIGNHPAVLVAAALYLRLGDDELECAGALLGEPLRLAPCRTIDVEVPAEAEVILEGHLDPDRQIEEGPVSEFHGMYERYGRGPTFYLRHLTRRQDAMFQTILPGHHPEHVLLGAVSIAAGLSRHLRSRLPSLREVAVTEAGSGRLSAVVALHEPDAGAVRTAMMAIWSAVSLIKHVTVVDSDIDPWDLYEVEWARVHRMDVDTDLLTVAECRTDRSEPLKRSGTVTKLGMDATARPGRRDWRLAVPPSAAHDDDAGDPATALEARPSRS